MIPFRVFDKKNKTTWLVLHYLDDSDGARYLATREDDTPKDGELVFLTPDELKKLKFVEMYEHHHTP